MLFRLGFYFQLLFFGRRKVRAFARNSGRYAPLHPPLLHWLRQFSRVVSRVATLPAGLRPGGSPLSGGKPPSRGYLLGGVAWIPSGFMRGAPPGGFASSRGSAPPPEPVTPYGGSFPPRGALPPFWTPRVSFMKGFAFHSVCRGMMKGLRPFYLPLLVCCSSACRT